MYNWIIFLYTWNKHKIVINYTSIKKNKKYWYLDPIPGDSGWIDLRC